MLKEDNDKFRIFSISSEEEFNKFSIETFKFQYENNKIYREYAEALHTDIKKIAHYKQIPFLPIEFFKTQEIISGNFKPEVVFESSGTTGIYTSKHFVKDLKLYEYSFTRGFEYFYGKPEEYCILALLPSYLEKENSSLIYMVQRLIEMSKHEDSGFYLNNDKKLAEVLIKLSGKNIKTIFLGVSYALLDFAHKFTHPLNPPPCSQRGGNQPSSLRIEKKVKDSLEMPLKLSENIIIMETGGMKGRRREMVREELHKVLCDAFGVDRIHSEYGMTELLSQAYSDGDGLFKCPPWMKVLSRDINDPFAILETGKAGGLNIIDLADIYSCSFIETKDICRIHKDGIFEVSGRIDNSDVRGCNQLIVDS